MRWQFLRFYLAIAVILSLAAGAFYYTVRSNFELALDRRLAESVTSSFELLRQKLEEAGDDLAACAEILEEFQSGRSFFPFFGRRGGLRRGEGGEDRPRRSEDRTEDRSEDRPGERPEDRGQARPEDRDETRRDEIGDERRRSDRDSRARTRRSYPHPSTSFVEKSALDLSRRVRARLDAGEVVVLREGGVRNIYGAVSASQVAVIGPFATRISRRGPTAGFGLESGIVLILAPPLAILLLIGVAIYFLLRPIEKRILALAATAKTFGEGALHTRATVGRTGAVDELEQSFNLMAGRIEQLVDGQKELLRAVSHDLRTPLARLFFALDDARNVADPNEKDRHIERIDRSLVELSELVEELLIYLRFEENGGIRRLEWVDIAPILHEAANIVSDLRGEVDLQSGGVGGEVFADPRYLKRAVVNLVTNAVRHTRSRVWIGGRSQPDAYVLSIDDDGPGIPQGEQDKIFQPFYRLDESRSADSGGSGLGLAIVAKIMDWHQGRVEVGTSPQGGARFTLTFPRPEPHPEKTAENPAEER